MNAENRWRLARFDSDELRAEFIDHARGLAVEGIEVEALAEGTRIRFRAPAKYEIGIADMISAHRGKVLPSLDEGQVMPRAKTA